MENKRSFKEFLCSKVGKVSLIAILYVVIYLIIGAVAALFSGSTYAGLIFALVFAVFGWKALNKIQPNVFLIMPVIGWVIFFVVKGVLSIVIGVFVAPYVIGKKIVESIQKSIQ